MNRLQIANKLTMLKVVHINKDLELAEKKGKELARRFTERDIKKAHKMLMQQGLDKKKKSV